MEVFGITWSMGALWFAAALVLAIAEVVAPGYFLIFIGAGAAVTAGIVTLVPGIPLVGQVVIFAILSVVAVAVGRRWYHRSSSMESATVLNDRTARLIGKTVEVSEPIVAGEGRVKVGDGAWSAKGPDAPAGALVRITGAAGSVLLVEPA